MPLPPPPDSRSYGGDWSIGADLGAIGVIWVGDIPLPEARDLVAAGWTVLGEPLPAPEPPPILEPPPPTVPFPPTQPGNDPVIEPRTPVTPPPLPPVDEPTLPPEPDLPVDAVPPGRPGIPPGEPIDMPIPPAVGIGLGQVVIAVGGVLWPSPIQPDYGDTVPPVDIPPPVLTFPPFDAPDVPVPEPTPFDFPEVPDVVVVTAPAPRTPPLPGLSPFPFPGRFPWPILRPRLQPRPAPRAFAPPAPISPPLPSAPPAPVSPSVPVSPPVPLPISPPQPSLPAPPSTSAPPLSPPLTPPLDAGVESPTDGQTCETPQQRDERRKKRRDSCRKLVRIRVKAHWKRVCVSEAIEHEARRYRRKLVRKYITKPAGELGKEAADWILRHTGLTPYADQAKEIKKRVSDLTKRQKRYRIEIPGTHVDLDPVDLIPKGRP